MVANEILSVAQLAADHEQDIVSEWFELWTRLRGHHASVALRRHRFLAEPRHGGAGAAGARAGPGAQACRHGPLCRSERCQAQGTGNGDAWSVAPAADGLAILVADDLDHGPEAAAAAVEAVRAFQGHNGHQIPTLLEFLHGRLRHTRGAAIAVARMNLTGNVVEYGGVGNIAGAIVADTGVKRMVSLAGTAGYNMRKAQSFTYPLQGGLVIMHSDGLSSGWDLAAIPASRARIRA